MRIIIRNVPNASVELMICDLSSMKSIREFISQFKSTYTKLDLLFNNAAVMKRERTMTEDGFETMFQVNYLAPFILMNTLVGLLKKGTSPQIINNTCPAYRYRVELGDLQFNRHYSMYDAFFHTKLYLLLAGLEFSRRHEDDGIDTVMAVPGRFKSDLVREVPLMGWFKNLFSAPVSHAAENMLYIMTSGTIKNKNGKVFNKRKEQPLSNYWKDTYTRDRLWSITESLVHDSRISSETQYHRHHKYKYNSHSTL